MTEDRPRSEPAAPVAVRPPYCRMLGLRYIRPSGLARFILVEGVLAIAVLLALAELASWWVLIVLPVSVAAMVKFNDVVAGAVLAGPGGGPAVDRRRVRCGPAAIRPIGGRGVHRLPGRQGAAQPASPRGRTVAARRRAEARSAATPVAARRGTGGGRFVGRAVVTGPCGQ